MGAPKIDLSSKSRVDDDRSYKYLAEFIHQRVGIHLPDNEKNRSLMASRLQKIMRERGLTAYKDYAQLIRDNDLIAIDEFICAMTTNTTHFFRESSHFESLSKEILKVAAEKEKKKEKELRVWCAAASSGQEPYTILMTLLESGCLGTKLSLKMLATDIDLKILNKAVEAIYPENQMNGVSKYYLTKYFNKIQNSSGTHFVFKPELGQLIRFAQFNLLDPQYAFQNKFDIIFCRNVLIYFTPEDVKATIAKLINHLQIGGLFYIGHSESGSVKDSRLQTLSHAAYKRIK